MDSVKQSAALCLLRLYKASPDLVLMGEWTSRVVHLLNDQHMVSQAHRNYNLVMLIHVSVDVYKLYNFFCGFILKGLLLISDSVLFSGCGNCCDLPDHLSQPEEP